jgi:hypothetical protein
VEVDERASHFPLKDFPAFGAFSQDFPHQTTRLGGGVYYFVKQFHLYGVCIL